MIAARLPVANLDKIAAGEAPEDYMDE